MSERVAFQYPRENIVVLGRLTLSDRFLCVAFEAACPCGEPHLTISDSLILRRSQRPRAGAFRARPDTELTRFSVRYVRTVTERQQQCRIECRIHGALMYCTHCRNKLDPINSWKGA